MDGVVRRYRETNADVHCCIVPGYDCVDSEPICLAVRGLNASGSLSGAKLQLTHVKMSSHFSGYKNQMMWGLLDGNSLRQKI